jgi:microsomal prostaglandin-E synthase 2
MVVIKAVQDSICRYRSLNGLGLGSYRRSSTSIRHYPNLSSTRRLFATAPVSSEDTANAPTYNLYQYRICPFSNIAKAVLKYQKIPYRSIEVNPLTKAELKFSKDYRKVPIVQSVTLAQNLDQPEPSQPQQFNGTEEILAYFASHRRGVGENDDEFASSPSSQRWQDFAKSKLAPLLYPNLCRTLSSSFRAFDYVHAVDSPFTTAERYSIQYVGSLAMYFAASKIKKKYQIDDVRLALDEALEELEAGLSSSEDDDSMMKDNSTTFLRRQHRPPSSSLSPPQPHLGDLAVFGVLKGLEGLPIFEEIMQDSRFLQIRRWYSVMDDLVFQQN